MMAIPKQFAVITGDIVNSSQLDQPKRTLLLRTIKEIFDKIDELLPGEIEKGFEIYRGDSFQGVVNRPQKALFICIFIKAYLRKSFEATLKGVWDARLALGVGEISLISDKGAESDGPAFRRSGPVLDGMKGDHRMAIITPWENPNQEFDVGCTFLDIVISRWSASQAEVVIEQLYGLTQQQIADKLGISQVAVHHRLKNSGWHGVQKFIKRYEDILNQQMLESNS